jgi:hypothetical protein
MHIIETNIMGQVSHRLRKKLLIDTNIPRVTQALLHEQNMVTLHVLKKQFLRGTLTFQNRITT